MTYVRSERVRGFQPPYYTVHVYRCDSCRAEIRVRQNWSGPKPPGAIRCNCGATVAL